MNTPIPTDEEFLATLHSGGKRKFGYYTEYPNIAPDDEMRDYLQGLIDKFCAENRIELETGPFVILKHDTFKSIKCEVWKKV